MQKSIEILRNKADSAITWIAQAMLCLLCIRQKRSLPPIPPEYMYEDVPDSVHPLSEIEGGPKQGDGWA